VWWVAHLIALNIKSGSCQGGEGVRIRKASKTVSQPQLSTDADVLGRRLSSDRGIPLDKIFGVERTQRCITFQAMARKTSLCFRGTSSTTTCCCGFVQQELGMSWQIGLDPIRFRQKWRLNYKSGSSCQECSWRFKVVVGFG
jgi:hypothetical protein